MSKEKVTRTPKALQLVSVRVRNRDLTSTQEKQVRAEFSALIRSHAPAEGLSLVDMVALAETNQWSRELARLDIAIPRIKKQLPY